MIPRRADPIRAWAGWTGVLGVALAALVAGTALAQPAAATRSKPAPAAPEPLISILCYHDISSDIHPKIETVTPEFLRAQIRSCKAAGWTFLPLSELLARRDRPESLPPRVMVLTFDDGYRSFVDRALPILREEGVKATLSIVTGFVDQPPPDLPPILSWEQIRALDASGDAEIAAHSHQLHRYETDNPHRDTAPSVTTRRYLLSEARYETRDEYRQRIRDDMQESQRILTKRLGHSVTVFTWPYGEHNAMAEALAAEAGYTTSLALGWREVRAADLAAGCLPRLMVTSKIDFTTPEPVWVRAPRAPVRAVQVDIDDLYDPDITVFRHRIDAMIARARGAGATHVFLQACPDPRGDGLLRQTWFMNHQTRNRADVWSMVAHKLIHARLKTWVRAPTLNLTWEWERHPEWRIPYAEGRIPREPKPWYYRVSPNLPEVRRAAIDFYTDLAVYLPIEGVLFDDDAYLLEGEALNGGTRSSPAEKAKAIRGLLDDLRGAVRAWRPDCRFARNVYAPVVERNGVHPRFSQDFAQSLRDDDLTVVMAYAHMEGHSQDAPRWISSIARRAVRRWSPPRGREGEPAPVMIKLQAFDWNTDRWVPAKELLSLAAAARKAGAANLGVYPVSADQGEIPEHLLEGPTPDSVAATR